MISLRNFALRRGERLLLSGVDYRIDMKALLCVKTKSAASP